MPSGIRPSGSDRPSPRLPFHFPLWLFLGVCGRYTGNMANVPFSPRTLRRSRTPQALPGLRCLSLHSLEPINLASCGFESYTDLLPPWRLTGAMLCGSPPASVCLIPGKCHPGVRLCKKNPFLKVLSAWFSSWGGGSPPKKSVLILLKTGP